MRRVVLVGMTLVALLVGASPAAADLGIAPTIKCYTQDAQSGTVTVTWGYVDTNTASSVVAIGASNFFSPPPMFHGQPVSFDPGVFPNVFQTTFDPTLISTQTWNLGGLSATFTWPTST